MNRVEFVAGVSTWRRISLMSADFIATARSDKRGKITTTVSRRPRYASYLIRHRFVPIPRLLRMIIILFNVRSWKSWLVLGLLLALEVHQCREPGYPVFNQPLTSLAKVLSVLAAELCLLLLLIRTFIGRWHAAEHMAVAAYESGEAVDIETIQRQNRVHDRCGGRFFLPFLLAFIAALLIARRIRVNETVVMLIIMECFLWLDTLAGFAKLPAFAQASRLLQHYATTRPAGLQEVKTAHAALIALLEAESGYSAAASA